MSPELTATAHLAVTWALVGLIWLVQIVHYPLFAAVGRDAYVAYQRAHVQRITWLVAPLMLAELALAVVLAVAPPPAAPAWLPALGLGLLLVIWLSTATVLVPQHTALEGGFDVRAHRRLVAANWIRTAAWSVRGIAAAALVL